MGESRQQYKVLIVKLGYSETLVPKIRRTCSLGDVFRSTSVLHLFKNDHVTWLTDEAAIPLLKGNPHIHRLMAFDLLNVLQLQGERFDKVINLEKVPGICAMVNKISAWSHYGFRFDEMTGTANAYDRAHDALAVATKEDAKRLNNQCWAEVLYSMLGAEWHGEPYILGYKPKSQVQFDLGFNTRVGALVPVKAWPESHWRELEQLVKGKYSYSYQQDTGNLEVYMDWVNSCRMLITNDSLGMFLGVAMGRKVLAMFGATPAGEVSPNPNLRKLEAAVQRYCMPCCKATCEMNDPCIRYISPQRVFEAIEEWGVA